MKGLIGELASLISIVAGALLAYYFADEVFVYLSNYIDEPSTGTKLLSYALIFITVVIVVYLIGRALTSMVKFLALGLVNRLLGGLFGMAKILIILLIVVQFAQPLLSSNNFEEVNTYLETSFVYQLIAPYAEYLNEQIFGLQEAV